MLPQISLPDNVRPPRIIEPRPDEYLIPLEGNPLVSIADRVIPVVVMEDNILIHEIPAPIINPCHRTHPREHRPRCQPLLIDLDVQLTVRALSGGPQPGDVIE